MGSPASSVVTANAQHPDRSGLGGDLRDGARPAPSRPPDRPDGAGAGIEIRSRPVIETAMTGPRRIS